MNLYYCFSLIGLAIGVVAGCSTPNVNPNAKPIVGEQEQDKTVARPVGTSSTNNADDLKSSGTSEPPRRIYTVFQEYPLEMIEKKIEGEVLVEFIVTKDGKVANAFAVRAPHPLMAEAAVRAISAWKFTPGRVEGKAVHTRMQQEVTFDLKQIRNGERSTATPGISH